MALVRCRVWLYTGACPKFTSCEHAHHMRQADNAVTSSFDKTFTRLCERWMFGITCDKGCEFAHGSFSLMLDVGLRRFDPKRRGRDLCPTFLLFGRCDRGNSCPLVHYLSGLQFEGFHVSTNVCLVWFARGACKDPECKRDHQLMYKDKQQQQQQPTVQTAPAATQTKLPSSPPVLLKPVISLPQPKLLAVARPIPFRVDHNPHLRDRAYIDTLRPMAYLINNMAYCMYNDALAQMASLLYDATYANPIDLIVVFGRADTVALLMACEFLRRIHLPHHDVPSVAIAWSRGKDKLTSESDRRALAPVFLSLSRPCQISLPDLHIRLSRLVELGMLIEASPK